MSIVVNARDVLLQSAPSRTSSASDLSTALNAAAAAQAAANAAATQAALANAEIANTSSDNVLSRGEKSAELLRYTSIVDERAGIFNQAGALGITTEKTQYQSAFEALVNYLASLAGWNDTSINTAIVGTTYRATWTDYFAKRQSLLNAIAANAAGRGDAAQATANAAVASAAAAQAAADAGAAQAAEALVKLTSIASDNVLSLGEKPELLLKWNSVLSEVNGIAEKADSFGVNRDAYYASFQALNASFPAGWDNLSTDTPVDGAAFRAAFLDYYTKRQTLLNALTAKAATTAQWAGVGGVGRPEDYATVGADASNLKVGIGSRNMLANSLPTSLQGYTNAGTSGVALESGGTIYYPPGPVDESSFSQYANFGSGFVYIHMLDVTPAGTQHDIYSSVRVPVTPGLRYEGGVDISAHRCTAAVCAAWYDVNGAYILELAGSLIAVTGRSSNGGVVPRSHFFATAPAGAVQMMMFVRTYFNGQPDAYTFTSKWYAGQAFASQTLPSPWSESAVSSSLATASALAAITAISSDSILSRGEKPGIVREWEAIYYGDNGPIKAQATALGVPSGDYTNAYNALESYLGSLTPAWHDATQDTVINSASFRTAWNNYYIAKTALQNAIAAESATTANWDTGLANRPTDAQLLNNRDFVITNPGGGIRTQQASYEAGAIKIILPVAWSNTMLKFTVDIYEYQAGFSCTMEISGYNYSANTSWINVTARVQGGSNVEYPVYFGYDPAAGKCAVWIGNAATEGWYYPQIRIKDVFLGYNAVTKDIWENGWNISISTAEPTFVSAIVWDTLPGADWSKVKGADAVNAAITAAQQTATNAIAAAAAAQADADLAETALNGIVSDNILSRTEKSGTIKEWETTESEVSKIENQASSLGVSYSALSEAHNALANYLVSLSPYWSDLTQDTPINGPTYRSYWVAYNGAKVALLNAIATKAATLATWSGTTGAGKPDDYATVGANKYNLNVLLPGDNLIRNSGFERPPGPTGLSEHFALYNNDPTNEPATVSLGPGRTVGQSQIVSWSNNHYASKGIICNAVTGWQPGKTYVISFYAKSTSLVTPTGMFLGWNNSPAQESILNPNVNSEWQRYAFRVTWGGSVEVGGTTYISISGGAGGGNVWFDDVMVTEGDVLAQWYPSTLDAQATADAANAQAAIANAVLANISNDNVLTPNEKPALFQQWASIDGEATALQQQAANFAIGTARTNYLNSYYAVATLLANTPGWNTIPGSDVAINGQVFRDTFANYYIAKQALINELAVVAGGKGDAAQVTANTAVANAAAAAAAAATANTAIAAITSDSILSKGEKPAILKEWYAINNEVGPLNDQASSLSVSSGALNSTKVALDAYLNSLSPAWSDATTDTVINSNSFRDAFNNYYQAKINLLNVFAGNAAGRGDAAQSTANSAIVNAAAAAAAAAAAQTAATAANTAIANISSDSVLSRGEKPAVIQQWETVYAEAGLIPAQAFALGVPSAEYSTAYTNLSNYLISLSPYWSDVNNDTSIVAATFRSTWYAYNEAKLRLLNAISAKAATMATWATGIAGRPADAELLNSAVLLGGRNLLTDSSFERGTRTFSERSAAVTNVVVDSPVGQLQGVKALFIESAAATDNKDAYLYLGGEQPVVVPGTTYIISFYYQTASNGAIYSHSCYFRDNNGINYSMPLPVVNTGGARYRASVVWVCPAGVSSINLRFGIGCNQYSWMNVDCVMVTEGNKLVDWTPAPADYQADIVLAQANAIATADAAAQAKANLAETTAKAYADGKVTAEEARAIADATTKANAAQSAAIAAAATDATAKANAAQSNAISTADAAAQAKANLAQTNANAYADGKVTAEETRAINDATNKANAAQVAAVAAAAIDASAKAEAARLNAIATADAASQAKAVQVLVLSEAYADGKVTAEEQRAINDATAKANAAQAAATAAAAVDATAKANAVAVGGKNQLANSLPGAAGSADHGGNTGVALNNGGPFFIAPGGWASIYTSDQRGVTVLHWLGSPADGTYHDYYFNNLNRMHVQEGALCEFGFDMSAHRCNSAVVVAWYNSAGNYIGEGQGTVINVAPTYASAPFPRSTFFAIAPPTSVTAMVFARTRFTGAGDPYIFVSKWYGGLASPGQTKPSPWSEPPGLTSTRISDAQLAATNAAASAATANSTLALIASDSILHRSEKPRVIKEWEAIYNESGTIPSQAIDLGVSSAAYGTAYTNLSNYLGSLTPPWSDVNSDSSINSGVFRNTFNAYYTEKINLLTLFAAKSARLALGVTMSPTGVLSGGGTSGAVETTPILDRDREGNQPPSWFPVGTTREFKHAAAIGLSDSDGYWTTLTTHKQFTAGGGGYPGYQYCLQHEKTWRRRSVDDAGSSWTPWVQDLDRNAYTGDLNASADIQLIGRGCTINGNTVTKTSGVADWNADAYSSTPYISGAFTSVTITDPTPNYMFGLNSDPSSNASFTSLDYAIYIEATNVRVYESGVPALANAILTNAAAGDVFTVIYTNVKVLYQKNGTTFREITVAPGQTLYFDCSLVVMGTTLKNIRFGPYSPNDWASVAGPGRPQDNATDGATWGVNIGGLNKPADNATVGAVAGVNLKDNSGAVLVDAAIKNFHTEGSMGHLVRPSGGTMTGYGSNATGALAIYLPAARYSTSTMLRIRVEIYEYDTGKACTYMLSGYNDTSQLWYNVSASYDGQIAGRKQVRFARGGGREVIYIGETNSIWQYPQVRITEVTTGFSGFDASLWSSGWLVQLDGGFATVEHIVASPGVGGALARVDQITSGNVATLIGNAAITDDQIANSTFTVSIDGILDTSKSNASVPSEVGIGTLTANVTGPSSYTVLWTAVTLGTDPDGFTGLVAAGTPTSTSSYITAKVSASNVSVQALITLIVTDSRGRSRTATRTVSVQFGSPQ